MKKALIPLFSLLYLSALVAQGGDQQPPTVQCLYGNSIDLPPEGAFDYGAYNFLLGLWDNVTPDNQMRIGVRIAGTGTGFPVDANGAPQMSLRFDCNTLDSFNIELWAMDLAGNTGHCTTYIIIEDPLIICDASQPPGSICIRDFCGPTPGVLETGFVFSSDSSGSMPPFVAEGAQQCLLLEEYGPVPPHYSIAPYLDDNPLNGVNTYDLILLSNHIRGIQPFTQPWQWVAADANRDNVVDLQDSVEFSNLLQGIYLELPNNTSWRFVRSGYVFPSSDPLSQPIPESVEGSELTDSIRVKFYGIKIGDLDQICLGISPVKTPAQPLGRPQLFPNPTNAGTSISFYLQYPSQGQIQVQDISGKLLFTVNQTFSAGRQTIDIPAKVLAAPGVYFWSMELGGYRESGKLIRI